jgi:uncharacterized protein
MNLTLPVTVPLFPLPDHVLLIGLPAPFRIFEPRYRALVDELLTREHSERWLAMPRLAAGWQEDYQGSPPFDSIAAVALARTIRPLDDGQFMVMVEGIARCRLSEVPSHRPFRLASVEAIAIPPETIAEDDALVRSAIERAQALCDHMGKAGDVLRGLIEDRKDMSATVDRLGAAVISAVDDREAFLRSPGLSERLRILNRALRTQLIGLPKSRRLQDPSEN